MKSICNIIKTRESCIMASPTNGPQALDINVKNHGSCVKDVTFHGSQSLKLSEVITEIKMLYTIAFPMIITGLLVYGRSLLSMLFLGRLGKNELAGGSLAMGIANITGYSVISGLAMGMEAITSQAFGAKQWSLMEQTLQRTVILLLIACIPLSLLWLNIQPVLLLFNQDPTISSIASTYLMFCLPDLVFQSFISPLRIYLRSQNILLPLILSATVSLALHAPINYILIHHFCLGIKGVALAVAFTDFNLLACLLVYVTISSNRKYWIGIGSVIYCFDKEWKTILSLALPSCCSVCLEWWWYELMIILSGILPNAADNVATMGILLQVTALVYIFPSSLSLAVSTRVGNELGANRPEKARASSLVALLCAIFTSLVAMFFMVVYGDEWGRAFTKDKGILSITTAVIPVVGLCELGNCPQTTCCGVLRGTARPSIGANINLGSFYGVGLPLAVFLGFGVKLGLVGLWLGLLAAQMMCTVLMVWVLRRTDWAVQAERGKELISVNINGDEHQRLVSLENAI